ncbi:UNKNOWN [Stylonychia lemnae]|uniref:CSC1/OSCA1-like cytosolic domain-containing protein n=1 Tax=Stylonychia lemnae TaxID=5949 RepID=A0A078BF80_STYLE|nr:UNKNOWN [Stylonychia lemnae]|eukprot:CDW91797.1 UNKNOWN [Stylonychia lemnae]
MQSPNFSSERSSEQSLDNISEISEGQQPSRRNIAGNVMFRNPVDDNSQSPELQDDDVYYNKNERDQKQGYQQDKNRQESGRIRIIQKQLPSNKQKIEKSIDQKSSIDLEEIKSESQVDQRLRHVVNAPINSHERVDTSHNKFIEPYQLKRQIASEADEDEDMVIQSERSIEVQDKSLGLEESKISQAFSNNNKSRSNNQSNVDLNTIDGGADIDLDVIQLELEYEYHDPQLDLYQEIPQELQMNEDIDPNEIMKEKENQEQILRLLQDRLSAAINPDQNEVQPRIASIVSDQSKQKQKQRQNERDSEYYQKDASNGLSYTKMKQVINRLHPRVVIDGVKRTYPLCKTKTGWHCACKSWRDSDIRELGVGISVYFKMLKFFMVLMLWFAFLSIPSYFLYYTGNETEEKSNSIKFFLSAFSLGNIGQQVNVRLFCSYGSLDDLKIYGLGKNKTKCPKDTFDVLNVDGQCNSDTMNYQYQRKVNDRFQSDCHGEKSCNFTISINDFNSTCQKKIVLPDIMNEDPYIFFPANNETNSSSNQNRLIYVQAICQEIYIELPYINQAISRENLGLIVVILDVVIIFSLIFSLYALEAYEKREDKLINRSLLTSEEFAIVIKHLPSRDDYFSIKELKVLLWNHLERVIKNEPQVLLLNKQSQNDHKILNIHFGMTDFGKLKILIRIYDLLKQLFRNEARMAKDSKNEKKYVKVQEKLEKRIEKLIASYQKYDIKFSNQVIKAYVTFRTLEGKERAIKAYKVGSCRRRCANCCGSNYYRKKEQIKQQYQHYHLLDSQENGQKSTGTFILIVVARSYQKEVKEYSPQIDCPDIDITKDEAFKDQRRESDKRLGLMHCYCLSQFYKISFDIVNIVFPDSKKYCGEWLKLYTLSNSLVYLVAFGISIVNMIVKSFMRYFGISINNFPIFAGEYDEFTVEWYRVIGATISFTLLINIFTPHMANGMFQVIGMIKRCRDRGCTCDRRKTKQLLQSDYEDMNTGTMFLIEYRYSQILSTLFTIMMYSSGIPILYIIALFSFFFQYWFDKLFYLSNATRALMKFSLILHFIIGLYMYSNSSILTTVSISTEIFDQIDTENRYFNRSRFTNLHMLIFIGAFALSVVVFIFRVTLFNFITCCRKIGAKIKQKFFDAEILTDDLIKELNFQQLFSEFKKTKFDMIEYKELLKYGEIRQQTTLDVNQFLDKLEEKQLKIIEKFQQYFQKYDIKPKSLQDGIEKLRQKQFQIKFDSRLRSVIYSYDLKDNDQYRGIQEVEHYLKAKKQIKSNESKNNKENQL